MEVSKGVWASVGGFGFEENGQSDRFREAPERWAKTLDAVIVVATVARELNNDAGIVEDAQRNRFNTTLDGDGF